MQSSEKTNERSLNKMKSLQGRLVSITVDQEQDMITLSVTITSVQLQTSAFSFFEQCDSTLNTGASPGHMIVEC